MKERASRGRGNGRGMERATGGVRSRAEMLHMFSQVARRGLHLEEEQVQATEDERASELEDMMLTERLRQRGGGRKGTSTSSR